MEWAAVVKNPYLKNLPFKIELDKWGKILMSPASNNHGQIQFDTGIKLHEGKKGKGKVITECSIETSQGVKVADVVWASDEFIDKYGYQTPYKCAPEVCVEVVSPSNSDEEMKEKIELYLAKGAHEVWIVSEQGEIKFYSYEGEIAESIEISS